MSKRQGIDGISLHGLVGCLMVLIRAQDKSRAPPPHSFIGLTCQRGSGAAEVWVRQVSQVQAALGPTSLAISPRSSREALIVAYSLSFGYGVTPLIAGALAEAVRVHRRQASGS